MIRKGLAIGIILLFVGVTIAPAIAQNTEKSQSTSRGNWLYVGGSGPGNYTKIQDAVDNATDGDTVFVYEGLYNEGDIKINKSINVIGENKEKTIVDGTGYRRVFYLTQNQGPIEISEFTVQSAKEHNIDHTGFCVISENNIIHNNIIRNNDWCGLEITSNTRVYQNIIYNNTYGIGVAAANNIIRDNVIFDNENGIYTQGAIFTRITGNSIKNNDIGIYTLGSLANFIYGNEITQNTKGISIAVCGFTLVTRNNIYKNTRNADFYCLVPNMNLWIRNYWGPLLLPIKIIIGIGAISVHSLIDTNLPWFQFDILPRRIPYLLLQDR